ncbi:MAG: SurA N-terminal domain-containing protein [Stenotrophobium sp.]
MLQSIRDSLDGWVVWLIVGIIVVPFAFWGIESFRTGGGDPVVAKVGSQDITQSQFRNSYEQRYQQLVQMMGDKFRPDMIDQTRFRASVLADMTQESMMQQYVRKQGYYAGDAALYNYLSAIPAFQDNGKFTDNAYKSALSQRGLTPERFEAQLRDSLEIDQLRDAVVDTAFINEAAIAQAYRLDNEQRSLAYAVFDYKKYLAGISISDDQVKLRYETDKLKFMAPERVKLSYLELSMNDMTKADAPKQDVLKVIYDAEKDSMFTTPEQRRARHILVAFGADKAAAKAKIEAIAAKLKNGADFAELAKQDSDDTGSKSKGGELGWIQRGQMVAPFDKALFALKSGETSSPVESEFGWHLIQLEEVRAKTVKPFDDAGVQQQLVNVYQQRELQKRFQEQSEKLEQLVFENPASLDVAAKALNLKVQTTDWITHDGGTGIAANAAVKQVAFAKETLSDGDNSKPISLSPGDVVVIRKADYEAPRQKTLQEVTDSIRTTLKDEAARAKAAVDAQQMAAAARAGRPLAELASARGVNLKSPGLVKRDNATEDKQIIDTLFRLPHPQKNGDVVAVNTQLADGDAAVVALTEVVQPTWPPTDKDQIANIQQVGGQLRETVAGAEFADYRKAIAQQIKTKIVNAPVAENPNPDD